MKTHVRSPYPPSLLARFLLVLVAFAASTSSAKNLLRHLLRSVTALALLAGVVACGGGGEGADNPGAVQAEFAAGVTPPGYPVGGTLSGLQPHETVVLLNNRTDALTLAADGTFVFPTQLRASATYSVTVKTPPPNSTCSTWRYKGVVQAIDPNAKPGTVYPQLGVVVRCRPNVPPEMTIGGALNGLGAGKTVVLANNNTDLLSLTSNGPMAFAVKATAGSAYSVTVKTQPDGQLCTVAGGSGTVVESTSASGGPVPAQEAIVVNCSNVVPGYRISGTLSGLTGTGTLALTLIQSATSMNVESFGNGNFSFSALVPAGNNWAVSVVNQPAGLLCDRFNYSGTAIAANVGNVQIVCTPEAASYRVRGRLSGLAAGQRVVLTLNGGSDLALLANDAYTFDQRLAAGQAYAVAVKTQPAGQTCVVTKGSGIMPATTVNSTLVNCTDNVVPTYAVSGLVSGLDAGKSLVLSLNGNSDKTLLADAAFNGSFVFDQRLASGQAYDVSVKTHPAGQNCTVSNGNGTIAAADVNAVRISCSAVQVAFTPCLNISKKCIQSSTTTSVINVEWVGQVAESADGSINPRTAKLKVMTPAQAGGIATEFSYLAVNNVKRTVTPTGGHPGFGFVVSHYNNGINRLAGCGVGGDNDSPVFQPKGTTTTPLALDNHRVYEFRFNYPRAGSDNKCYQVPVTVNWMFVNGWDNPLFSINWDIAGAKAADGSSPPAGVIQADSRAPYGSMAWGGGGAAEGSVRINRMKWYDSMTFSASGNPMTMSSTWVWAGTQNATPYVSLSYNDTNVEYGLAATLPLAKKEAGGYPGSYNAGFRGVDNSSGTAVRCADNFSYPMPCEYLWPYQTINYTSGYKTVPLRSNGWQTDPYFSPQLGWGTVPNLLGGVNVDSTRGGGAKATGYPQFSYATFVYLGLGTGNGAPATEVLAKELLLRSQAAISMSRGTLATQCPAGPGRNDLEACGKTSGGVNNGYWASRASYLLNADANSKFTINVNSVGLDGFAGTRNASFFSPTFAIRNFSGAIPQVLTLTSGAGQVTTLRYGREYSASLDAAGQTLWLTMHYKKIVAGNVLPAEVNDAWTWSVAN